MPLQPGDICLHAPGWASGVFVIVHELDAAKQSYHAIHLLNGKLYTIDEPSVRKIGRLTECAPTELLERLHEKPPAPVLPSADDEEFAKGRQRAERESQLVPEGEIRARWRRLAAANPGDAIEVRTDATAPVQTVRFHQVFARGQKYVFMAESDGRVYRYPLGALVVDTAPSPAPAERHAIE